MLELLNLPDQVHRRLFGVKAVQSAYPDFLAGELVDVIYDGTEEAELINKIAHDSHPTGDPWMIFRDTEGRRDYDAINATTVVRGTDLVFRTDMWEGSASAFAKGTRLAVTGHSDTTTGGVWIPAASGHTAYGVVDVAPLAEQAAGGILQVRMSAAFLLP
jgi:hypothetical protein